MHAVKDQISRLQRVSTHACYSKHTRHFAIQAQVLMSFQSTLSLQPLLYHNQDRAHSIWKWGLAMQHSFEVLAS